MSNQYHTSYRPRPTTADALLTRKRPYNTTTTSSSSPYVAASTVLADTSNHPPKRPRTSPAADTTYHAPDWNGNEHAPSQPFGSTPGPYANAPSFLPPPPLTLNRSAAGPRSLAHNRWGLRREVVLGFAGCGITEMYPWQEECLVRAGERNVVYTAPTSSGKSLVADLLMIRKVMEGRKAVVVVPYIAIVQEKTKFLKKVLANVKVEVPQRRGAGEGRRWRGVNVVGYHSGAKGRVGWQELDVAVCTTEKANAMINAAVEDRSIDKLGIVVFDEIHTLDDEYRGYILELLATKLLCIGHEIQIVAMSATLSNARVLATWLKAEFYECDFRPIPLEEYVVCNNEARTYSDEFFARIPVREEKELQKNPVYNAMVTLACATVYEGHGVLIFCPTRQSCETLAKILTHYMPSESSLGEELVEKRRDVVRELATCSTGLDFGLEVTVSAGVAFHHSGLTGEEKDIIADAFDQGVIKAICCTPTMSSGVNLPARRVILSPKLGMGYVAPAMFQQMRGRAGRKGKDTCGQTYICCTEKDLPVVQELIKAEMPALKSCLASENSTNGLTRALLEIITTGLANSSDSIDDYFRSTLYYHLNTTQDTLLSLLSQSLTKLQSLHLIEEESTTGYWAATKMGRATVAAGFSPEDGVFMHTELSRALQNFNLESDMHIVYHFTPIHNTDSQSFKIDWNIFRTRLESLDEPSLRAATFVNVNPAFVHRMAQGSTFTATADAARVHRRFYSSLILRDLINEVPVHRAAARFDKDRGSVQALAMTCRGFAATSATYCRTMGWTGLAVLLEHYAWRLDLGVRDDLIELARLPFVRSATARVFHDHGLRSVEVVAKEGVERVLEALVKAQPKRLRLKDVEEGKLRARLRSRAEVVVSAAENLWARECAVELDE